MGRKADPRVLLAVVALAVAVVFCLYKAIGAFTNKPDRAQGLPSPAFVQPPQSYLSQDQFVNSPRLPTNVEVGILNASSDLGRKALAISLSSAELTKLGMSANRANAVLADIQRNQLPLSSLKPETTGVDYGISAIQGDQAVVSADVILTDTQGLSAPQTARIRVTWSRAGPDWASARLADLSLTLVGA